IERGDWSVSGSHVDQKFRTQSHGGAFTIPFNRNGLKAVQSPHMPQVLNQELFKSVSGKSRKEAVQPVHQHLLRKAGAGLIQTGQLNSQRFISSFPIPSQFIQEANDLMRAL